MFPLYELSCCCHGFVLDSKLSAPAPPSTPVASQLQTSTEEKPRAFSAKKPLRMNCDFGFSELYCKAVGCSEVLDKDWQAGLCRA
jgi:hypothetical protein